MNGRLHAWNASGNPVIQAVSLFVFGLALVGAVLMGALIVSALLGLAVLAAVVFSVRLWWLRRKLQRAGGRAASRSAAAGELIEAEYTVIDERDPLRRRRYDDRER